MSADPPDAAPVSSFGDILVFTVLAGLAAVTLYVLVDGAGFQGPYVLPAVVAVSVTGAHLTQVLRRRSMDDLAPADLAETVAYGISGGVGMWIAQSFFGA
jgi:hypothetical protein